MAHPHRVLQERGTLGSPSVHLGHHRSGPALHTNAVADVLAGAVVLARRVDNAPSALLGEVVGTAPFVRDDRVFGVKRVSSEIVFGAGRRLQLEDVRFDKGVVDAIYHRINANAEHVLVVLRIDIRRNGSTKWSGFIVLFQVHGKDSSEADLEFDASVLVKVVIPDVFWKDV